MQQEFRMLIATAQENTALRIQQELSGLSPCVHWASTEDEVRNGVLEGVYSILLIFLPFPGNGVQLALDAAQSSACAIMLSAREEQVDLEARKILREAGVLFLPKPLSRERLHLAVESAICMHRRMAFWQKANEQLQKRMQDMHAIDRAKYLLMQTLGMTESQAHHFIEKQAMDARQSKAEVARRILRTYENT